jgi:hypothetical protein
MTCRASSNSRAGEANISVTAPRVIAAAGDQAARRVLEFFAATIRNKNMRMAYYHAVVQLLAWCDRHMIGVGRTSRSRREGARRRAMPDAVRRVNNAKSKMRSTVEHVFAEQKNRLDLFIRTVEIARATVKIGLANFVYNIKRLRFLRRTAVV